MATFRNAAIKWDRDERVHIVSNSVNERSARFTLCGRLIGGRPVYDGVQGNSVRDFKALVPSCPVCVEREKRVTAPSEWVSPVK